MIKIFVSNMVVNAYDEAREVTYVGLTFNGGERQIRLNETNFQISEFPIFILAHIKSAADIMDLLLITDALRRQDVRRIVLSIPYLPYARQDRVCAPGEALSLKVFANLINSQNYDKVYVWDCHSDVGVALIDRCVSTHAGEFVKMIFAHEDPDKLILVAPDAGAIKKVHEIAKTYGLPMVRADKKRDPSTGNITGTVVYLDGINDGNKAYLIVDDICDGGRTFIELAKQIRKNILGPAKVYLYVTHGIFSAGFDVFNGLIDKVYVANVFKDLPPVTNEEGICQFVKL